jgi:hypothetical protein
MLPDFRAVKAELTEHALNYMRKHIDTADPIIRDIRKTVQHEGDVHTYTTTDGEQREMDYGTSLEGAIVFTREERTSGDLTVRDVFERVHKAADEMVGQSARHMFDIIGKAAEEVGNTVSAGSGPMTFDLFLETIDRMQVDFDEDTGKPTFQLVMGPELAEKTRKLADEWESNPEYTARHDALIRRKREEWNAREARRKLVD